MARVCRRTTGELPLAVCGEVAARLSLNRSCVGGTPADDSTTTARPVRCCWALGLPDILDESCFWSALNARDTRDETPDTCGSGHPLMGRGYGSDRPAERRRLTTSRRVHAPGSCGPCGSLEGALPAAESRELRTNDPVPARGVTRDAAVVRPGLGSILQVGDRALDGQILRVHPTPAGWRSLRSDTGTDPTAREAAEKRNPRDSPMAASVSLITDRNPKRSLCWGLSDPS